MTAHPISPVYDSSSRILILGSFPSVKSRETGFFYGHPQNRFWRVLSSLFGEKTPETVDEKREFLLRRRVAVWDVIASCDITGSSDSSIKNVMPNDLSRIFLSADIRAVFTNGRTAHNLYVKYIASSVGIDDVCLPSTSPANAAFSPSRLAEEWGIILDYLR